jgi:hypothetical protein
VCFFLAACAKESAVTFPLLLLLFDWIGLDIPQRRLGFLKQAQVLWLRQWPVYAAVLAAGIGYLALRYMALGFLLHATGSVHLGGWARLQNVAYTLLTYLRILFFPMIDLAPTHVVESSRFATFSVPNAAIDVAAFAIAFAGVYGSFQRKPFCYLILAVTVSLLPVLHIAPVEFDPSLYHERYIMLGLALALSLLPRAISEHPLPWMKLRVVSVAGFALGLLWLAFAVITIRVTLPLWSDHIKLWQWELLKDPRSQTAKVNLLGLYLDGWLKLDHHDRVHARQLADEFLAAETPCPLCLIDAAQ